MNEGRTPKKTTPPSRREILKWGATAAAGAAVLGVEGTAEAKRKGMSHEDIQAGLEQYLPNVEDPHEYLQHFRAGEYVVDDLVLRSYAAAVDPRPKCYFEGVRGGYIDRNRLDQQTQQTFREILVRDELPEDKIEFYLQMFSTPDIIVFGDTSLQYEEFISYLPHERMHQALTHLGRRHRVALAEAAQEIAFRKKGETRDRKAPKKMSKEELEARIGQETFLIDEDPRTGGHYSAQAAMNWEEFYTYLAQGVFPEYVEQTFQQDYPKEWGLFDKIRQKCNIDLE